MALGPQFKNTHWTDEKGNTQSYVLNTPNEPFKITKVAGETSTPTQGMLFSPETGTGSKNDPLVPHERRMEAITKGLGMSDTKQYAKRAGYSMSADVRAKGKPLSERATNKAIDAYTNALDNSNLSTYEIEKHLVSKPALGIANTNMTRGHISGGTIRLPYQETYKKVEVPEQVKTVRTGLKLQPIPNPELAEQVKNVYWDSQNYVADGVFNIADIVTPDGSAFDKSPYTESDDIPDFRVGHGKSRGEIVLPPGHHFNVWPGSGKDVTDPDIVVKKHEVYDGNSERGESIKTFHTRHKIVGHEGSQEEVIPARVIYEKGKDGIDEESLVHELGHHFDPNVNDPYNQRSSRWIKNKWVNGRPDPAQEGVADGFAFAHNIQKDVSRELLEQGKTDKSFSNYGYSTTFSGFANNTSKALYAAMAAHTAANPRIDDLTQVPSRESLYNKYKQIKPRIDSKGRRLSIESESTPESRHIANTLLLGHMYDNHDHVRNTLHDLGLGKAGLDAHKFYKENDPTRYKGPEQTKLPGFE